MVSMWWVGGTRQAGSLRGGDLERLVQRELRRVPSRPDDGHGQPARGSRVAQPQRRVVQRHERSEALIGQGGAQIGDGGARVVLGRGDLDDLHVAGPPQRAAGPPSHEGHHPRAGLPQAPRRLGRSQRVAEPDQDRGLREPALARGATLCRGRHRHRLARDLAWTRSEASAGASALSIRSHIGRGVVLAEARPRLQPAV